MPAGMLIDTTKCILCLRCENECHSFYGLPNKRLEGTDDAPELDAYHYVVLQAHEVATPTGRRTIGVSKRCLHCFSPACASVCPVGALHKTKEGPVVWEEGKCIGCRYCQNACPFDIPKFEWDVAWPKIQKCIFCHEKRLLQGKTPVCAEVCPTQAIRFGERADMIALAHQRIAESPEKYFNHVYGEEEVGGTLKLYIGAVDMRQLGFPSEVEPEMYPEYTHEFLSKIPIEIASLALFLGGAYLFRSRREAALAKQNHDTEKRG
ncbi:4Fe-4S dicluster domain-containing protein [Dehalogenimonas alkenigignens]|uniref:Fe-S-cluster-containing hydrogenase components 1 n=1 Tax=Dehalogenimonas alkenigignens TaxID=1217799 RepID=A0A0W0GHE5_9CHLR|nr:4Fe-4S dicluster domain-containing protein [Dehalogenimonas alkenigignens]KTB47954.1 Fe-S-cluster-containing hydrogenase components 1 [Dehalogenimonas alkenigignens]PVV83218.1 4Fe-4S dicluster domain-containing protein [Dehalogenimonas alkenigignens]